MSSSLWYTLNCALSVQNGDSAIQGMFWKRKTKDSEGKKWETWLRHGVVAKRILSE